MPIFRRGPGLFRNGQGMPQIEPLKTSTIDGRRYVSVSNATYMLPKDMAEVPRLDFQHYLLRQAMKGLHIVPVPEHASAILDVGCGTGRWCIEMAQSFSLAQVIGIDLEEMVLPGVQKPDNYTFKQANALERLPFTDNSFDFVHMRMMLLSIPTAKWPNVLREILRVMRPGSKVEFVEVGCTIFPQGPATQRWYRWLRDICNTYEQDADMPTRLRSLVQNAGLGNVNEYTYDIPIGRWAGHLGVTSLANLRGFYEAMRARIGQLKVDPKLLDQTWPELAKEWETQQAHLRYYVVCGQKEK